MNNQRRKQIEKAARLIEQSQDLLEAVRDEEQESLDNMPENLEGSKRVEAMELAVDNLDECRDIATELLEKIEEASQ